MDIDGAVNFMLSNHRAVLHTFRRDGGPQLSPITVGVDDGGHPIVSSRETAFKVKNVRRDAAVSLCVFADDWYGGWIQVDGSADVLSLPEAMEPLVEYYRVVAGEHPDWDDYRAAMERDRRVLLRITIDRVGPTQAG